MENLYGYIKSLHLIFVITWFAGLFYVPRLFINHIEASLKSSPEKEILTKEFKIMTKRLWLGFVFLLILYHLKNHQIFRQLQKDDIRYTSNYMRIWNEGATIILFAIVFLVVLKSAFSWIYGVVGIILLGVLLMLGIKLYKRIRDKNSEA